MFDSTEESRRQLQEYLDAIEKSTTESQKYLHTVVRKLQQMQFDGVFEQIRGFQQALDSVVFPRQAILAVLDQVQDAYARLLRQIKLPDFEAWARAEREATKILSERGWWPHPEWPAAVVYQVIRLKREGRIRQLDRAICASYEANRARPMRQAIRRWVSLPEFRARRRILEDGLWAYRRKKYGLAVTHWLPQIEGILRGFAERQGFAQGSWKQIGRNIRAQQPDYAMSFTQAFFDALASLYRDSLPIGRRAPKGARFPVQRDSILHGVNLRFGRRAHAMRVFLMLGTLHFFISSYETAETSAA